MHSTAKSASLPSSNANSPLQPEGVKRWKGVRKMKIKGVNKGKAFGKSAMKDIEATVDYRKGCH
jgi:hypothetical protein